MGEIRDTIVDAVSDTKVAAVVSGTTTGSGVAELLGVIPNDIGKLGVVIGMVLSTVLIITHIRRAYFEYKKGALEIDLLKMQIEEKKEKGL